jgi:hypothetical protein
MAVKEKPRERGVSILIFQRKKIFTNNCNLRSGKYLLGVMFVILLAACNPGSPLKTPTMTPTLSPTPKDTATPVATSIPTALPPALVLITPPQADPALTAHVKSSLEQLAAKAGLRLLVKSALSVQDLTPDIKIVAALPPLDNLQDLASTSTSTQFISLGIPGLKPTANLSLIGGTEHPDELGFIAGATAAILTEDWRVGVITLSDTPGGKAAGLGFHNGVIYFCGLCHPNDPPIVAYPVITELPSNASQSDWQAALQTMVSKAVKTVYVFPDAGNEAMLAAINQAGLHIIGNPPSVNPFQAIWIASIQSDIVPALQQAWPEIVSGKGGFELQATLTFTNINPALFSQGRQDLANKIMADLLSGAIDTGVDPQTGEAR